MPVSAAYMIAKGFDASVANGTCHLHTEASIDRMLTLMAKCDAAEIQSAKDYLGADWGKLGREHYKLAATIGGSRKAPGLRQLGGKAVAAQVAELIAAGYVIESAGTYAVTGKGAANGKAADLAAGRTWAYA